MQNKYPFISGSVIQGQKIARKLGFPTMNIEVSKNLELNFGVYAGFMEYNEKIYPGVINYGITPCFEIKKPKFEIHLFNFNKNLYGEIIKVVPTHYLRKEIKFDNIDLLIKQIEKDCIDSQNYYKTTSNSIKAMNKD